MTPLVDGRGLSIYVQLLDSEQEGPFVILWVQSPPLLATGQ